MAAGRRSGQLLRASRLRLRADALRLDLSDAGRSLQSRQHRPAPAPLSGPRHRLVDPRGPGRHGAGRDRGRARRARCSSAMSASPPTTIKLNAYSATPEQVDALVRGLEEGEDPDRLAQSAARRCRKSEGRSTISSAACSRGGRSRPAQTDRPRAGLFRVSLSARPARERRMEVRHRRQGRHRGRRRRSAQSGVEIPADPDGQVIKDGVHEVKALLNDARVPLNTRVQVEYSHHYGVRNFRKVGAVLINVHQPRILQEGAGAAARPDASLALPQAQGRDLPGAVGHAACRGRRPPQGARPGQTILRAARRLAPLLDRDRLRVRGDLDHALSTATRSIATRDQPAERSRSARPWSTIGAASRSRRPARIPCRWWRIRRGR